MYASGTGEIRLLNSHRIDEEIGATYHRFPITKPIQLIQDWAKEMQKYPKVWRIMDLTPKPGKPQEAQADVATAAP